MDVSSLAVMAFVHRAGDSRDGPFSEERVREQLEQGALLVVELQRGHQEALDYLPALLPVEAGLGRRRLECVEGGLDDPLDGDRNGALVIGEVDGDGGTFVLRVVVGQLLRLDHHLPVAAAELSEDPERNVRDLVGRVPDCSPQSLHQLGSHGLVNEIKESHT